MEVLRARIFSCVLLLSKYINPVSPCETTRLREQHIGSACPWGNQIIITGAAEHECILQCLLKKTCKAVNYDIQKNVCKGMEMPCPVIQEQPNVRYKILAPTPSQGCVQWVSTHDWNNPRHVKINSNRDVNGANEYILGVARLIRGTDVVPCNWPNNGNCYTHTTSGAMIYGPTFDILVVDEMCSLRWVFYDASVGDPLPSGAIQGGQWTDGTPLYVATVYAGDGRIVPGNYNHATRMGSCDCLGTFHQRMDLLVALWKETFYH